MDKKTAFRQLAEKVSCCHLCAQMMMPPHHINGERLENDNHGLNTTSPYVNQWNLWCYNLDAEILVVGQDYGTRDSDSEQLSMTDPTTIALIKLFKEAFDMDLTAPNAPVFFTNAANCYRQKKTTGSMHPAWIPLCAHKFLGELISIIQPKFVIALGREAFMALTCLNNMPLQCCDPQNLGKDTLSAYMQHQYALKSENKNIAVFPVYHPGALGQRNRPLAQQIEDWKRIAEQTKTAP